MAQETEGKTTGRRRANRPGARSGSGAKVSPASDVDVEVKQEQASDPADIADAIDGIAPEDVELEHEVAPAPSENSEPDDDGRTVRKVTFRHKHGCPANPDRVEKYGARAPDGSPRTVIRCCDCGEHLTV